MMFRELDNCDCDMKPWERSSTGTPPLSSGGQQQLGPLDGDLGHRRHLLQPRVSGFVAEASRSETSYVTVTLHVFTCYMNIWDIFEFFVFKRISGNAKSLGFQKTASDLSRKGSKRSRKEKKIETRESNTIKRSHCKISVQDPSLRSLHRPLNT